MWQATQWPAGNPQEPLFARGRRRQDALVAPYRTAAPEAWIEIYRRGAAHAVFEVVGVLIMTPFGLLLVVGGVVGGYLAVVGEWAGQGALAGLGSLAMALLAVAFGGVLLRSSVNLVLDLLQAPSEATGPIDEMRVYRGSKSRTYFVRIGSDEIIVPRGVYEKLAVRQRVLLRYGAREREVRQACVLEEDLRAGE